MQIIRSVHVLHVYHVAIYTYMYVDQGCSGSVPYLYVILAGPPRVSEDSSRWILAWFVRSAWTRLGGTRTLSTLEDKCGTKDVSCECTYSR